MPAGESSVERPFAWRVLEDAPSSADAPGDPAAPPEHPSATQGPPGALQAGDHRGRVGLAVLGVVAAAVAAFAAIAVVVGGSPGTTLSLPGDAAGALAMDRLSAAASPRPGQSGLPAGGAASAVLVVDVAGAVRNPGVYRLAAGSRVVDAVAAAGGYGPRVDAAAVSRINLAAPLHDGEQVRVPSRDDPADGADAGAADGDPTGGNAPGGSGTGGESGPIDINSASADALDTLPGIGPATAAKILAARAEAPFASVDELRSRGVVGEATFAKIRDLVTVGP